MIAYTLLQFCYCMLNAFALCYAASNYNSGQAGFLPRAWSMSQSVMPHICNVAESPSLST